MYKILKAEQLANNIYLMDVEAPRIAKSCNPGQFIIAKLDEKGERIPLTICDYDRENGTITIVFQVIGASTEKMSKLNTGDAFRDFTGPLGQPSEFVNEDLEELKKKVDTGAEYLVTQMFFDNDYYYRLVREARKLGITVPILAGIMPITNAKSLIRTTKMCGCTIPYQLSTMIEAHYDNPEAMKEIGINYAAQQIIDLITNGVDGIHIYTMNRAETAQRVFDSIPAVLKELN